MRPFGRWFALFAAYLLLAVIITYPLAADLGGRLIGHPFGDAYEYLSMAWWLREAIGTGRDPFTHSLIVYPDGASALWLWSAPLQSLPTLALGLVMPLAAAFNAAALLTLAGNGLAMFALVRGLLKAPHAQPYSPHPQVGAGLAAFVAGAAWLTLPAIQGQLGAAHTGLIALWGAPLWLLALLNVARAEQADRGRPRRAIVVAALLFPVALAGNPTIIITLIGPLALTAMLISGRGWRRVLLALILGGLVWLPLAAPFLLEAVRGGRALAADVGGQVRYSAPALAIAAPAVGHPFWGFLGYPRAVVGREPFELTGYLGLITAGLCALGLARRRAARPWLILALAAWVASLGPLLKLIDAPLTLAFDGRLSGVVLPWAAVQDLPGLSLARTPARFSLVVGFAGVVMAGFGAHVLLRRLRGGPGARRALAAAALALGLAGLIAFDAQTWFPLPTSPAQPPPTIAALGENRTVRAVLDLPIGHPLTSKEALFLQTGHGLPILIGHVTRRTPIDPAKALLLEDTLDPALLALWGADAIILHRPWADPAARLEERLADLAGPPIYADDDYAVYLPPSGAGQPTWTTTAPRIPANIEAEPVRLAAYASAPTGALLSAALSAPDGPLTAVARVDGVEVGRWTIAGGAAPSVFITLDAGTHLITLAADPPCPAPLSEVQRCRALVAETLTLAP